MFSRLHPSAFWLFLALLVWGFGARPALAETLQLGNTGAIKGVDSGAIALGPRARPGMRHAPTDQDAADMPEMTPGALGRSTLSLLLAEKRTLAVLAIDGVKTSVDALVKGRHPCSKSLYPVVGGKPSPAVQTMVAFVRSPRGQKILTAHGQHLVKR